MRLKSLEIKGFKSFANATTVTFDAGVTGIVGPNGSGKSNIVDSIRWVLGEQKSKELRLESMGDVIFNGTKSKKKSGAAQVTLRFENTKNILPTEYKEVAISRTLYRSGDSEYHLNNVKCRLKDIKDLFLDSGIGSNTYAIIELGMVDDILSDKDNARRKMFEQAAGISKYKIRKREAQSKLALTIADLDRVEDLLFELEDNMKSLEKQAKRTEKFYAIKAQYKELKVHVSKAQIEHIEAQLKSLQTLDASKMEILTKVKASIATSEASLEALKTKNLNDEVSLNILQKKVNDLVAKIQSIEGTESLRKQEISFLQTTETNVHRKLVEDKKLNLELQGQIERQQETLQKEKFEALQTQNAYKTSEAEYTEFKKVVDNQALSASTNQQLLNQSQQEYFNTEKTIVLLESSQQRASEKMQSLQQTETNTKTSIEELKSQLDDSTSKQTLLKAKLEAADTAYTAALNAEANYKQQKQNLKDEQTAASRKLDKATTERTMLKSMVESLEGFPESVKFIHNHTKGKIPLLSDLFFCPADHKAAVESFLDNYLHYFVADSDYQALDAIKLLKEGQKGRASFFVLDRLAEKDFEVGPESIYHMLEFEAKYSQLFAYIFGQLNVVDIAPQVMPSSDYVLQDSTMVQRQFTISGGSIGLFEGKKVGRKKALEDMHKQVVKLTDELDVLTAKLRKLDQEFLAVELEPLRQNRQKLEVELNSESFRQKDYAQRYAKLVESSQQYETAYDKLKNEIAGIEIELKQKKQALIEIQSKREEQEALLNSTKEGVTELQAKLRELSTTHNTLHIEMIKKDNYVNMLLEQSKTAKSQQEDLQRTIRSNEIELEKIARKLEELTKNATGSTLEITNLYAEKAQLTKELATTEQVYFAEKSSIQEKEKSLREFNNQQLELQSEISQAREREHTFKYERKSLLDRLQIEFGLNEDDIQNEGIEEEEVNLEDIKLKLEKLENRIQNYGDINPMAITAFNEIKERHAYIVSQRNDILDANKDLEQTIKEIEIEANEMFKTAFDKIKIHFQECFRTFFTEDDDCDLLLLDAQNPLDSEIEILAKPKGKRPKSLSQLSGGEKTLTATALLFALYLLKPAPFCIFDEVDAPLDDLNVQKFTKLISQFSKNSQFVIITHNKVTMAAVDTLYGVFMQEVGVSEISSVDFSDKSFDFNYQPILN